MATACVDSYTWFVIGRLFRPTVTVESGSVGDERIAGRLNESGPAAARNRGISVVPLSPFTWADPKPLLGLWMLVVAVFCVF